jgi:hypothetical protein
MAVLSCVMRCVALLLLVLSSLVEIAASLYVAPPRPPSPSSSSPTLSTPDFGTQGNVLFWMSIGSAIICLCSLFFLFCMADLDWPWYKKLSVALAIGMFWELALVYALGYWAASECGYVRSRYDQVSSSSVNIMLCMDTP